MPVIARSLVDHALDAITGLRAAGAAIRRGGGRVREHALGLRVDQLDVVHAGQAAHHVCGLDVGADRADVGAHAAEMPDAQRQELAPVVERELDVGVGVAGMIVAHEGLVPAGHPEHRPADLLCADQHRDVFGVGSGLEPERAANLLGDHAEFRGRHAHDRCHRVAHGARALRADPQQVAAVRRVIARGTAAWLHRGDVDALVHQRDFRHMRRRFHRFVDLGRHFVGVGGEAGPIDRDVARRFGPDLRRAWLDRRAEIGYRVERREIHLDRFGAVLRRCQGLADHHRHRLADVAHAVARQRRPNGHDQLGAAAARNRRMLRQVAHILRLDVGRGDHRDDALHRKRRRGVDRLDVGAGVLGTYEAGIGLAR